MADNSTNKRAPFIVIEGLDRSGKSTQAAILLARLDVSGIPAKLIKFPGEYKHPNSSKPRYLFLPTIPPIYVQTNISHSIMN